MHWRKKRIALPSAKAESFTKVHEVMNRGQRIQCTKGDLRIPMVRWTYTALCKNLAAKSSLRL